MQQNPGYIYILVNPSMEGLVKIGKTTEHPDGRAKELSSATGVATPFFVVYHKHFENCAAAESFVHTRLSDNRLSDNKEFFRISINDAIQAIMEADKILNSTDTSFLNDINVTEQLDKNHLDSEALGKSLWKPILNSAIAYYQGSGEKLQDTDEALKLFKQAANLGCAEAYWWIGEMFFTEWVYEEKYIKRTEILKQAIRNYKESANLGYERSWGNLGICYWHTEEYGNSDKCWIKFYTSPYPRDNNIAIYDYSFIKYLDGSRFYPHHEALESYYQELKKGLGEADNQ